MSLYFLLLLITGIVPLSLSFDKRLQFYKSWKYVLPSIFAVAAVYIAVDVYFTKMNYWGFNPDYLSGVYLFHLPIEEVLFFIVVPYASIFLHESILEYFPQVKLSRKFNNTLTTLLIAMSLVLLLLNTERSYTFYIFTKLAVALSIALWIRSRALRSFYLTFLVILIPFLIVNGILTGSFINGEVVWYNNDHNLGFRIFTIPVEDFAYAFSMILLNLLLIEKLKKLY
ncbi:lycopene cyclase domain-containing protein [Maribellus sediminis]|uniref:lycopene cyclase domain-containing protein n=1 Tax=Maribellus sediminis TaxID=2696285 RepID=UPI001432257B|nr:lycopene cyclase domain-containing protein [Maribellus sediminis]